jgi:Tfp pilus assembly protein PilN
MAEHRSKQSNRRSLQFSLRTLLVAMLVVAAYFGGRIPVHRELEAARQRMSAIEKQAAAALDRAKAAQQHAEMQRLVAEEQRALAEHQMQATKVLLERQESEARLSDEQ